MVLTCIGFVVFCLFSVLSSESFKECEHTHKDHQAYEALHKDSGLLVRPIIRTQLHFACSGIAIGANDTAVTALSGAAVALFTLFLWISTEQLYRAGEKQLRVAIRSTIAAKSAAGAAQASVELAKSTAASINRAYVGFVGVLASTNINSATSNVTGVALQVFVKNAGQTPTRRVLGALKGGLQDAPPDSSFDYGIKSEGEFWPEISATEERGFGQIFVPVSGWTTLINKDGPSYYIWGWVEYSDVFAKSARHRTEFCVRLICTGDLASERYSVGCIPVGPHNATDDDCVYPPQTAVAGAT